MLGGTRTEPQYFGYVKKEVQAGGLDIQLVAEGWTPRKLYDYAMGLRDAEVRAAKKSGDSGNVYDEVWVVSDVDEFVAELQQMRELSRESGIRLAITNPCFEAWLSMHVDGSSAKLDRHQAQARAKTQGLVEQGNPKHVVIDKLRGRFKDAATRSRRLAADHLASDTKFPHDIPASDVHLLVGGILAHALKSNPDLKTGL